MVAVSTPGICGSARHFDLWDFTVVTPDWKSLWVYDQANQPVSVTFGNSGTKLYVLNGANDTIYQYTLGTAWEAETAVYDSVTFVTTTESPTPQAVRFSSDGTNMYVIGYTNNTVYQYSLGTAWDISTAGGSPIANSFDVSNETSGFEFSVIFGDSGTKMYVQDGFFEIIYQYDLGTAWDVTSAVYNSKSFDVSTEIGTAAAIELSTDGTKLYVIDSIDGLDRTIYQYELGTAWDISTGGGSPIVNSYNPSSIQPQATDLYFSDDGNYCYILNAPSGQAWVKQYALGTAWDISTASMSENLLETRYTASGSGAEWPRNIKFNPDGTKLYVLDSKDDALYQYTVSNPWEIGTATYDSVSFTLTPTITDSRGFDISDDGTRVYITQWLGTGKGVYEYVLGTPWDISSMGGSPIVNSYVPSDTNSPYAIQVCDDGTKMYLQDGSSIDQYTLSTPYDVSTASYDSTDSFGVSIYGFQISDKGNRVAILDSNNDRFQIYRLTVHWDLSTAVLHTSYDLTGVTYSYSSIHIGKRGTRLYTSYITGSSVYQYVCT